MTEKVKIIILVIFILIIIGALIGGKCLFFGCIFMPKMIESDFSGLPEEGLTDFEKQIAGAWYPNGTSNVHEYLIGIGMPKFIANLASSLKVSKSDLVFATKNRKSNSTKI